MYSRLIPLRQDNLDNVAASDLNTLEDFLRGLANGDYTFHALKIEGHGTDWVAQLPILKSFHDARGSAEGPVVTDASNKIPAVQLPSYVDDIVEYASLSALQSDDPQETGKIYVTTDTNKTYRYSGTPGSYVVVSETLALGETSSTAHRGDHGKAAYDHSQDGNIHLSAEQKTDLINGGESSAHYHAADRARGNHTGTQPASTISDFDTEVGNHTDVAANSEHRGAVTGNPHSVKHSDLSDKGSNSHTDIDNHMADSTIHAVAVETLAIPAGEALSKGDVVQIIGGHAYRYKHIPSIGRGVQVDFSGSAFTLPTGKTTVAVSANLIGYLSNYSAEHRIYSARYNADEYEDAVLLNQTINIHAHRGAVKVGNGRILYVGTGIQASYYSLYAHVGIIAEGYQTLVGSYGTVLNHFSSLPGTATYGADAFALAEDEVLVPYGIRVATGNWELRLAKLDPSGDPIQITLDTALRADLYQRSCPRIFWLGGDDYFITYIYNNLHLRGFKINTAKGATNITQSSEITLLSSYGTYSNIHQLSEKYLVITYYDGTSTNNLYALLVDVSGSTPSVELSSQQLGSDITAEYGKGSMGWLTANTFLFLWGNSTDTQAKLSIFSVDGTGFEEIARNDRVANDFTQASGNIASRSESGWAASILGDGNDPSSLLFSAHNILPYQNVAGIVGVNVSKGATATIVKKGGIIGMSGLVAGDSYYATGHGKIDNVCPSNLNEGIGLTLFQPTVKQIGRAVSTTEIMVDL